MNLANLIGSSIGTILTVVAVYVAAVCPRSIPHPLDTLYLATIWCLLWFIKNLAISPNDPVNIIWVAISFVATGLCVYRVWSFKKPVVNKV